MPSELPPDLPVTLEMIYAQVRGLAIHVGLSMDNRDRIDALELRVAELESHEKKTDARLTAVEENQAASAKTAKTLADAALRLQMAQVLGRVAPSTIWVVLILSTSFAGGLVGQLLFHR